MTHTPHSGSVWPSAAAGQPGRAERLGRGESVVLADTLVPWICLLASMVLWVVSLPQIEAEEIGALGLITVLPGTMVPAFGLVASGFVLALRGRARANPAPYVLILMMVVLLHGTPVFAYENLRYAWAWKHLGIIDYIQRTGSLDPWERYLAAYHNWPGFFLVFAGIGKLFGLDPLAMSQIARFFPLGLNLLYATILPYIFRRLTRDLRLVWTATAVFVVGNWVGQDYFSPQGTAFLLLLIILALCLGPLAIIPRRPLSGAPALSFPLWRFRLWSTRRAPVLPRSLPMVPKLAAIGIAFFLILAIVASHQLTPMLMIAMLTGLFVIGRLSIGFALFAIVAEILWLAFVADPSIGRILPIIADEFGKIDGATFERVIEWGEVSEGQRMVSLAGRVIVASLTIAAIAGCIARLRRGYRDGIAAALALAPLPLAVSTSYGGEVLFRVYFFALPFLSFFAGALLFPTPKSRLEPLKASGFALFLMTASAAFFFANNGKDAQYRFSAGEVAAAQWLYASAEPDTLLIEGATSYPRQFQNYENMIYVPLAEELPDFGPALRSDPAGLLTSWLRDHEGPGYAIFTRSQSAYFEAMNLLPGSSLDGIVQALLASPDLSVAFAGPDAIVFELSPPPEPGISPEEHVRHRFQLHELAGFSGLSWPLTLDQLVAGEENRLTKALTDAGYLDARVTISSIGPGAADWLSGLNVDPGPFYEIGAIWISGLDDVHLAGLSDDLRTILRRAPGEPLSQALIEDLSSDIAWLLEQAGYPFPRAGAGEIDLDRPAGRSSVEINVDPGERAVIGTTRIEIAGQSGAADGVAAITLPENEPYSRDRIDALYTALIELPFIDGARIELDPKRSNVVDVLVRVDPAPPIVPPDEDLMAILFLVVVLAAIASHEGMKAITHRRDNTALDRQAIAAGLLAIVSIAYVLMLFRLLA